MPEYDVIIAGGGPAGAAAAIALARSGYSVVLVERSRYDRWRIGETLPPEARLPLADLGVWEKFLAQGHVPSYAIHAEWGGAGLTETDFIFNPYGSGWHLDRRRFDHMLAGHAEDCGATVLRGCSVAAALWRHNRWEVRIEHAIPGVYAGFLVDTTGRRAGAFGLSGAPRLIFDRMVGIAGVLSPDRAAAADPVLLLEAAEEGWWYSVPLPGGSLLVSYITDADLFVTDRNEKTNAWTRKLAASERTSARAAGWRLHGEVRIHSAATSRLAPSCGPGWMAIGDAAASYDPLSADGITKAMHEGLEAARVLQAGVVAIGEHSKSLADSFDRYLQDRSQYYRGVTRWPSSPFWRRRHSVPEPLPSRRVSHAV
jgi:flavin-dependent dehydrogenase